MDTFQPPPPPLLPDLVISPTSIPPPTELTAIGCFQDQQQQVADGICKNHANNCHNTASNNDQLQTMTTMLPPNHDNVVQMMMDCSMGANDCSSDTQTNFTTYWTPTTSSSTSSTTFNDYSPHQQQQNLLLQPPSPHYETPVQSGHILQPPQLLDMKPDQMVWEIAEIMKGEHDKAVLTNSVCLLFRLSIDKDRGLGYCQAMSASERIMDRLYYVMTDKQFENDDLLLCYATGNLTNMSNYEEGRAAILGWNRVQINQQHYRSPLVDSLIRALQSRSSNGVIFAITAIHNLLRDTRNEYKELAKDQIKDGIKFIVQLLEHPYLMHDEPNFQFKVIVLDCLLILAYGNSDNRLAIKRSKGPYLLLRTIRENLDKQTTDELIDTASRVLKSLSACAENKNDIIKNDGIKILTECIERSMQPSQCQQASSEILKTCLWTLRNLSDLINHDEQCMYSLVEKLLHILYDYASVPSIVTCALGILANLTCNNEFIKRFICDRNGVNYILNTIGIALSQGGDFRLIDRATLEQEIFEPAICALCHLMNQTHNPNLAELAKESVMTNSNFIMFKDLISSSRIISEDLAKAMEKLDKLTMPQSTSESQQSCNSDYQ